MSDLFESVQANILEYVKSKKETHIEADVLRVIRDQSALLYETQLLLDALTQDPMQQLMDHKVDVERLKKLLSVISCDRVVTYEGLSSINAVVQFRKDAVMNDVDSYIQLSFEYERGPMQQNHVVRDDITDKGKGTYIKYRIDFNIDHQQKHPLLNIECWAQGEAPSVEPAVPLDGWDDMEEEDDENQMKILKEDDLQNGSIAKEDMEDVDNDRADRFAAYIDPEIMDSLLHSLGVKMEEGNMFFFLMTFPFWEHEWDLVGFVLDVVFGECDDKEDEMIEFDDEGNEISTNN